MKLICSVYGRRKRERKEREERKNNLWRKKRKGLMYRVKLGEENEKREESQSY